MYSVFALAKWIGLACCCQRRTFQHFVRIDDPARTALSLQKGYECIWCSC